MTKPTTNWTLDKPVQTLSLLAIAVFLAINCTLSSKATSETEVLGDEPNEPERVESIEMAAMASPSFSDGVMSQQEFSASQTKYESSNMFLVKSLNLSRDMLDFLSSECMKQGNEGVRAHYGLHQGKFVMTASPLTLEKGAMVGKSENDRQSYEYIELGAGTAAPCPHLCDTDR